MNSLDAIMKLSQEDMTPEEAAEAMQVLIDSGEVWNMEGHLGRTAMRMIEDGLCVLGPETYQDYYGNPIPGRNDVNPGTKGSVEYANERRTATGLPALEVR